MSSVDSVLFYPGCVLFEQRRLSNQLPMLSCYGGHTHLRVQKCLSMRVDESLLNTVMLFLNEGMKLHKH